MAAQGRRCPKEIGARRATPLVRPCLLWEGIFQSLGVGIAAGRVGRPRASQRIAAAAYGCYGDNELGHITRERFGVGRMLLFGDKECRWPDARVLHLEVCAEQPVERLAAGIPRAPASSDRARARAPTASPSTRRPTHPLSRIRERDDRGWRV
jgi:hypothetical protein